MCSGTTKGFFAFVLHSHLPYVLSHGRWPHGVDWLNEAAAESYVPLLDALFDLRDEGISPRVTIGLTPVLMEQLADPEFATEFEQYLDQKVVAAKEDQGLFRTWNRPHLLDLARMWERFYRTIAVHFRDRYGRSLVDGFRELMDEGHIEIITCAATHGYLPLLSQDTSVEAQIRIGCAAYERHMGRSPRGIWLPECAYRPRYSWSPPVESSAGQSGPYLRKGVEEFLSENGIDYFVIDAHLLRGGKAIGVYMDRFEALRQLWKQFSEQYEGTETSGENDPTRVYLLGPDTEGKKPVAVFTRDPESAVQVWSGEHGYPGDGWYLDFHKKHFPGGLRYWRVTSSKCDLADKWEYEPDKAAERTPENAAHFASNVRNSLLRHHEKTGHQGVVCAPYDTELFGHWWFEGPVWLKEVLRILGNDPDVELTTCADFLAHDKPSTVVSIPEGSWGEGGFHYIWLNEWTKWTWKHIYDCEVEMQDLARQFGGSSDERLQAVVKQAARELLLLQSSDWQFLISTWSARDYAELRVSEHYSAFQRLVQMARAYGSGQWVDPGEWAFLGECEKRDRVFQDLDVRWFAEVRYPPA